MIIWSLDFWGTVADKARRLARLGTRNNITDTLYMLTKAVNKVMDGILDYIDSITQEKN